MLLTIMAIKVKISQSCIYILNIYIYIHIADKLQIYTPYKCDNLLPKPVWQVVGTNDHTYTYIQITEMYSVIYPFNY